MMDVQLLAGADPQAFANSVGVLLSQGYTLAGFSTTFGNCLSFSAILTRPAAVIAAAPEKLQ